VEDTVAVALIAVAGTLASGGLGYLGARARTQVEMRSISATMARFEAERSESDKESRKTLYREFVSVISEFEAQGRHLVPDSDVNAVLIKFQQKMTDMQLFATWTVVAKAEGVRQIVKRFTEVRLEIGEDDELDRVQVHRESMNRIHGELKEARIALLTSMRQDLAAGT
jgi:hypothetical protein